MNRADRLVRNRQIIADYHAGATQRELAARHGLTAQAISLLLKRAGASLPTGEWRARNAAATKAMLEDRWQDPEFRARQAAATKANWQDPEFRARQAAATKAMLEDRWQDPEFRARQAAATKANWQDPEFRARQAAATKAAVGIQWDADMDAALRTGIQRDECMASIADTIGVCTQTAVKRADALGLPRRRRVA